MGHPTLKKVDLDKILPICEATGRATLQFGGFYRYVCEISGSGCCVENCPVRIAFCGED